MWQIQLRRGEEGYGTLISRIFVTFGVCQKFQVNKSNLFVIHTKYRPLKRNDDYRHPDAYKDGGFGLIDKAILSKYRSAGKDLIK